METLNILEKVEFGEQKAIMRSLLTGMGMRILLVCIRKGQILPEHSVPGPITVQGLTGHATFYDGSTPSEMKPGTLVRLAGGRPHRIEAQEDATLLVTVCDPPPAV